MEVIIKTVKNKKDNRFTFKVICGNKNTSRLDYAEMLGLVSALTMPEVRPTELLLSEEQHQEINQHLKK
jgi:hypothetical protein